MDSENYAQINYDSDNPDDAVVAEVKENEMHKKDFAEEFMITGWQKNDSVIEHFQLNGTQQEKNYLDIGENVIPDNNLHNEDALFYKEKEEIEQCVDRLGGKEFIVVEHNAQSSTVHENQYSKEQKEDKEVCSHYNEESYFESIKDSLAECASDVEKINRTLSRLDKKFGEEILNADNRDTTVKTIYKELNEYKAGLIEKALKNVLYDFVDIREMMLSQIKYIREKEGLDSISLDEFESYTEDIGDILEKHDVTIYKGKAGEENVAVRQKIVRKVETEDETLVKKVAESLSYGYEYNSKILYPEKISIFIKKNKESEV